MNHALMVREAVASGEVHVHQARNTFSLVPVDRFPRQDVARNAMRLGLQSQLSQLHIRVPYFGDVHLSSVGVNFAHGLRGTDSQIF